MELCVALKISSQGLKSYYYYYLLLLMRIRRIRKYLSQEVTETLVHAFILLQ